MCDKLSPEAMHLEGACPWMSLRKSHFGEFSSNKYMHIQLKLIFYEQFGQMLTFESVQGMQQPTAISRWDQHRLSEEMAQIHGHKQT